MAGHGPYNMMEKSPENIAGGDGGSAGMAGHGPYNMMGNLTPEQERVAIVKRGREKYVGNFAPDQTRWPGSPCAILTKTQTILKSDNIMIVLIDNGHGIDTAGKCSPDNRLREYAYCREIARGVSRELTLCGVEAKLIVPEMTDTPLKERVRRVNDCAKSVGAGNVVLVSIHNNAAGSDGKWHTASGFSVFISKNASNSSKHLAQIFTNNATEMGLTGNRSIPPEKYWVQSLAMTRDTICPAVLTENLFQDNEGDVNFLLSEEGKRAIVTLHVNSIVQYINSIKS